MPTKHQALGDFGEHRVAKECRCFSCKRFGTLKTLPTNFKCADLICDFCGYLAQVKTARSTNIDVIPDRVLGASWEPQRQRMEAGIYFPLFLVLVVGDFDDYAIYYLPADLQTEDMFRKRLPLRDTARRGGWTGFIYNISAVKSVMLRIK